MSSRGLRFIFAAGCTLAVAATDTVLVAGVEVQVKDDEAAKEWLETLSSFSETFGSEAQLFEGLDGPESSKAWSHSFALIGALGDLVTGFLGDKTSEYVKAIEDLQRAFDQALSAIQQQLNVMIQALQADFIKAFLAPKSVVLRDAISALTVFSQSDKGSVAKNVWKAQMEPIAERVDAWNAMVSCLTFSSVTCPGNMYDIVLGDGMPYQRPAVLAQFSAVHYSLLSSSAAAICAYQKFQDPQATCSFIDVSKLQKVASTMTGAVTKMKTDFWGSTGTDKLPPLFQSAVDSHANQGYNGAVAIRDQIREELDNFYFAGNLNDFFGISSWLVAVYQDVTGGDKHWMWDTGEKFRYQGYNIMYTFANGGGFAYSDNDCRSGDAHEMASCLQAMHGAAPWVLHDNCFFAASWNSAYGHSYTTSGADIRVVVPGSSTLQGVGTVSAQHPGGPAAKELAVESWAGQEAVIVPPPGAAEGVLVARPLALRARDVPSDPSSVMKDISNIFATAGAIADFFGPEGEIVGLVLEFIASIFSLFSTLLGLGQPDPVIEALRAMEKDVMGRLSAVSDSVAQARQVAAKGSLALVLDQATQPLVDIVDSWNALYPNGAKDGKLNPDAVTVFKQEVFNDMSKYRDSWNTLAQCLSGSNTDCIFDNQNALQVLTMDGQIFQRPLILTQIIQYYFILLQKSSVAICAAAHLFLGDTTCSFMTGMSETLQSVAKAMSSAVNNVKAKWWGDMGEDKLIPMMQYYVDQRANQGYNGALAIRDAIRDELDNTHFANGLGQSLGVSSWSIAVYQDVSGGDKHWMWASGEKFRYNGYNIMYNFANGGGFAYSDNDCRSGDAHAMASCLNAMHGAAPWVLHDNCFWAASWNSAYGHSYTTSGADVRIVVPGSQGVLGSQRDTVSMQHPGDGLVESPLVV